MKINDAEFARQLAAATKRGEQRLQTEPLAKAVSWDHSLGAVIDLNNGCRVCVPLSLLPELKDAKPRQLQNVEIMGVGQAVQWPDLDQQVGIAELLTDVWNATQLIAAPKRRGSRKSIPNKGNRSIAAKDRVPGRRKPAASR